jgi:hypothetical protein
MFDKFSFILDDVLEAEYFKQIQKAAQNSIFKTIEDGDKKFYVSFPPQDLSLKIQEAIELVYGQKILVVNSCLRMYTEFLSNNWGIHADTNVLSSVKPSHGAVFFLSENKEFINGTALWKHKQHGYALPEMTDNETNNFTNTSYNDEDQWDVSSIIGGINNRLISYPANYFHSKFPKQAWGSTQENCRLILAMFYKIETNN